MDLLKAEVEVRTLVTIHYLDPKRETVVSEHNGGNHEAISRALRKLYSPKVRLIDGAFVEYVQSGERRREHVHITTEPVYSIKDARKILSQRFGERQYRLNGLTIEVRGQLPDSAAQGRYHWGNLVQSVPDKVIANYRIVETENKKVISQHTKPSIRDALLELGAWESKSPRHQHLIIDDLERWYGLAPNDRSAKARVARDQLVAGRVYFDVRLGTFRYDDMPHYLGKALVATIREALDLTD